MVTAAMKLRHLLLRWKTTTNLESVLKTRDITLPTKVCIIKAMVLYRCEIWTIKKDKHWRIAAFKLWCWRRHLRIPWTEPVHPKGNQSWIFIGRTDTEAEVPILWPLDAKNWLIGRDPDAGKDWRREEKGMTKDEMVGWHHWLKGHEFEQDLGVGGGQGGSLACCSPWGYKDLDTTEWLNWTQLSLYLYLNMYFSPSSIV